MIVPVPCVEPNLVLLQKFRLKNPHSVHTSLRPFHPAKIVVKEAMESAHDITKLMKGLPRLEGGLCTESLRW